MKKKKKSDYSNSWFEKIKKMRTCEDVCKEQLEKLPDVDLRNEYHKGQVVYYVFEIPIKAERLLKKLRKELNVNES